MFKYTRYGGKPLGEILRNMVPQKHVACPLARAFPQAPATAAVKNLWWIHIVMHLSLVKRDALSDKSVMAWGSHILLMALNWVLPERSPVAAQSPQRLLNLTVAMMPIARLVSPTHPA